MSYIAIYICICCVYNITYIYVRSSVTSTILKCESKKVKSQPSRTIQGDLKPFQARSAFYSAWIQAVDGLIGAVQDKGRSTRCGHGVHKWPGGSCLSKSIGNLQKKCILVCSSINYAGMRSGYLQMGSNGYVAVCGSIECQTPKHQGMSATPHRRALERVLHPRLSSVSRNIAQTQATKLDWCTTFQKFANFGLFKIFLFQSFSISMEFRRLFWTLGASHDLVSSDLRHLCLKLANEKELELSG